MKPFLRLFIFIPLFFVAHTSFASNTTITWESLNDEKMIELCETQFATKPKVSESETFSCLQYFLFKYGMVKKDFYDAYKDYEKNKNAEAGDWIYNKTLNRLNYDIQPSPSWPISKFSKQKLELIAKHAATYHKTRVPNDNTPKKYSANELLQIALIERTKDFFMTIADLYRSDYANINAICPNMLCALEPIIAGKPLNTDLNYAFDAFTLWKLRNAIFARHGKTFNHADLQAFFFDKREASNHLAVILPLKPNPNFKISDLTTTDQENLKLIQTYENKLKN